MKILELIRDREVRTFRAGEVILQQGDRTNCLYFLIEGSAEVLKDNTRIAVTSQPGAVFGELAVLLEADHSATVRALEDSSFYIVEDPRELLASSPGVCLHICELLAGRLVSLSQYLIDVKNQFEGDDHIGMVDQVLSTLLHRPPRERHRPSGSTITQGQLPD